MVIASIIGVWYFNRDKGAIIISKDELKQRKAALINRSVPDNSINNTPASIKVGDNRLPPKKVVYETKDDKFEEYDRIENDWLSKAHKLFSDKEFMLYQDMRKRSDQEKEKAYQAYHDYLRSKFGNNFKYNISEDNSILEKKINDRYQKELLKLVGQEKMRRYVSEREKFNEELRRNSQGKSFLIIEF